MNNPTNNPAHTSLDITWRDPTFIVPLFALCVLLGVCDSMAAALALTLIMTLILVTTTLLVFLLRRQWPSSTLSILIGLTLISLIEMVLHALWYPLYRKLGLYLPLCMSTALLLMRPELRNIHTGLTTLLTRALRMSAGFALAALVLSTGREIVGHGSLFSDAPALLGSWSQPLVIQLFDTSMGFVLGVLAPGAFVALGLGVALYNYALLALRRHTDTSTADS